MSIPEMDASEGFRLVGAYPEGQNWDVCREAADEARIAAVPLPASDPIDGAGGPLLHLWSNGE